MPENSNNPRNKPLRGGQFKMLTIWIVVAALITALMVYSHQASVPEIKTLTIHEVVQATQQQPSPIKAAKLTPEPNRGFMWHSVTGVWEEPGQPERPFTASGQVTEQNLGILQSAGFKEVPPNELPSILLTFMPILIILALIYVFFVRQIRQAGRGAMSFGKSRARMLTRDREKITFKDVAGCDEAKEEVAEIVEFLKDPKKFQRIGGRIPKGALLVGPPGTGKTLIARAVAGEADVPFFSISGSDFVEMFVGVGAARVRDMFEQGRKNAPCIIFIDEIDAVGRQRGAGLGGGNDEREQTLNSLLVEMDGFDGHEGVIIMAATNRPDVLDSALMRPGRFDRQIMIDLPDLTGREEILRVHAKKIKLASTVNLADVARGTPGFSGADLANLLNESALLAARRNKNEVDRLDIDDARDKISFGRERRKLMDDEDKRMTAYHEAGHALVHALLKDKKLVLHKVTIIPRGRALGMTMYTFTKDILGHSKSELLNSICSAMAGRIGEEVETGEYSNGASNDIKQATKIARHMVCDWGMSDIGPIALGDNQDHLFLAREITRTQNYSEDTARRIDAAISEIIRREYDRAYEMVCSHKDALEKIAQALLTYETIEAVHVHEILEFGEIRTPVMTFGHTPPPKQEENKNKPVKPKENEEKDPDLPGAEPALA